MNFFSGKLQAQCARFEPPDGKVLLIIGQDMGATGAFTSPNNTGYTDNISIVPGGITTYVAFPGNAGLNTLTNWGAGDICAECYTTNATYDQSAISIGLYMVNQLDNIINGNRDTDIDNLANWIKNQDPRPVFLRIGYEFNNPSNNYDPDKFVQSWIRIVNRFRTLNVTNVAFVWQSDDASANEATLLQWYPGDDYVDWVSYSHFYSFGGGMLDIARNKSKPLMIAEATPIGKNLSTMDGNTVWSSWFAPLLNHIHSNNDIIKAVSYINQNWDTQPLWNGQGWGDSRIQVNSVIKTNWLNEIQSGFWLNASSGLFQTLYDCTAPVPLSVNAGADQTFTLPGMDVPLHALASGGDNSYSYTWTQLSGSTLSIVDPNQADIILSNVSAGVYSFRVSVTDGTGADAFDEATITVYENSSVQSPYQGTNALIPGRVEVERYDTGGQGAAYYDSSPGNEGGIYRYDNVDMGYSLDGDGGYSLGWTTTGEWLEYTVDVTASGFYNFQFRVASPVNGKSFHLKLDGEDITGSVSVPNTGSWNVYQTIQVDGIFLNAGTNSVLQLYMETDGFNINYIEASSVTNVFTRKSQGHVTFFPNPCHDVLTVTVDTNKETEFRLTTLSGVSVSDFRVEKGEGIYTIYMNDLLPGVYLLEVQQSNEVYWERLLVK